MVLLGPLPRPSESGWDGGTGAPVLATAPGRAHAVVLSGHLATRPSATECDGVQPLERPRATAVRRPLRIVLLAAEAAGLRTLRMLGQLPHEIVGVVCNEHDGRRGTGSVAALARRQGAVVWPGHVATGSMLATMVSEHDVDLVLNVHFLQLLGRDVLDGPRIGCFNLHPGPLPRYAGLNVASWAIVNGEPCHAVTVHRMVARVDAGPVAYQERFALAADDTGLSVSARCVELGVRLLERLVETATADPGAVPAVAQEGRGRHYLGRHIPYGGGMPWTESAGRLHALVRACDYGPFASPWGRPLATHDGVQVEITKTSLTGEPTTAAPGTIGRATGRGVPVATGDEWLLVHRVSVDHHTRPAQTVLPAGGRFTNSEPSPRDPAVATAGTDALRPRDDVIRPSEVSDHAHVAT